MKANEELRDWRQAEQVVEATAAHERAARAVGVLEEQHRAALGVQREREQVVAREMAELLAGRGSLSQVNRAKLALAAARATVEGLEASAEQAYQEFADSEQALAAATAAARADVWPAYLNAYRAGVAALDDALAVALAREEELQELYGKFSGQFEALSGGWVRGPAGETVGVGMYGHRMVKRPQFAEWQIWVEKCGLASGRRGKRMLEEAGARLRALASA